MYMRAVGWNVGRKDKIDLDGPSLKEKQGLYACPPLKDGDKPFHCALEVHEELIKVDAVFSSHFFASVCVAQCGQLRSWAWGNAPDDGAEI